MQSNRVSRRFSTILMLIAAVAATVAIGVWQGSTPSLTAAAEQRSAFVQSGGVTTDTSPSAQDASQAIGHALAPAEHAAAATSF